MKEFKAESKRLLDLMINSIYTNKEIFLRELISNASDAIDKLYYESLTNKDLNIKKEDLKINISLNKEKRTITISDNGCGMDEKELENIFSPYKKGINGQFGLGLSIVRETLAFCGYEVTVRNEKKGVSFMIQ